MKFDRDTGRVIYVKEDYQKLNIYQEEHSLNKYENKNIKIEEIMREFEQKCQRYLNIKEELLQRAMKAFQKQKTWIIRILIVLIVADIVAIITLLKRIKRYEL